jgi:hypothetical protein
MFDYEMIYPLLAVAMVNLLVVGGTIAHVVRILTRQRAVRNAYRLRLAHWTKAAGEGPPAA